MIGQMAMACRTGVIFLRILGEQRRKRGERETRIAREEKSAKNSALFFSRSFPRARFARRAALAFACVRMFALNTQKNYACSAG